VNINEIIQEVKAFCCKGIQSNISATGGSASAKAYIRGSLNTYQSVYDLIEELENQPKSQAENEGLRP